MDQIISTGHKQGPMSIAADSEELKAVKRRFGIIGSSPLLLEAIGRAMIAAGVNLSVLVQGESGSGKEFFPKIIHHLGSRKHAKYIAVNCGAIPEGTIDSELFGHEKGSFTGAVGARKGYFEEASGGTIFLDEVAELPLTTQARLLRVLETGEFLRVGSSKAERADVRIVAATNVDLLKAVSERRFREDLYYRLSTIQIQVPCLHDRGDDVDLLARKFAMDFSEHYMTAPVVFTEDARVLMYAYRWPGNVRQLKNVVEQLALFYAGQRVDRATLASVLPAGGADCGLVHTPRISYENERDMLWQTIMALKDEITALKDRVAGGESGENASSAGSLMRYPDHNIIDLGMQGTEVSERDAERDAILMALARNDGSRKRAALDLGYSERTLYRKMKEHGINGNS